MSSSDVGLGSTARTSDTEEERAYALVLAMLRAEQASLAASRPVAACSAAGHRKCLPAAARRLARVASREQRPMRRAVRKQRKRSCSRRAGTQYLKSLRLLRTGALTLAHAKSRKAGRAAARILTDEDRLQISAVNKAERCWRATLH